MGTALALWLYRGWFSSLKIRYTGCPVPDKNGLFVLWHEHLLIHMRAFRNKNISVLISPSKDGQLAADICLKWGYQVFRGSGSRNAVGGFKKLMRQLALPGGNRLGGMALDGPKGPYHHIQAGSQWMVERLNLPVYPIIARSENCIRLKSWDKSLIPLPFSRVLIHVGYPAYPKSTAQLGEIMASAARAADSCRIF